MYTSNEINRNNQLKRGRLVNPEMYRLLLVLRQYVIEIKLNILAQQQWTIPRFNQGTIYQCTCVSNYLVKLLNH